MLNPTVQLLQFLLLANFPSGSSINYQNEKLYLVGDDARIVLVLDKNYQAVDSIVLFEYSQKRIPKSEKADLESSAILDIAGAKHLLVLGSASTEERKRSLLIPLLSNGLIDHTKPVVKNDLGTFIDRLTKAGLREVNIEGAVHRRGKFILANRGSKSYPENYLIITNEDFWIDQKKADIKMVSIEQEGGQGEFLGISELCYVESMEVLLLAFTSEATINSYEDGVIGNSYIGWVSNANKKLKQAKLKLDGRVALSNISDLKGQKIEGVCLEHEENSHLLLHLISDNDNGESKLFKILLKF